MNKQSGEWSPLFFKENNVAKPTHKNHGHKCPVCNPPKRNWIEKWKTRKVDEQHTCFHDAIRIRGTWYYPRNYTEMVMMEDTKDWTDDDFLQFYKFATNNMPPSAMSADEELREFKKIYRWWK